MQKKKLTINCIKTEYMVMSKKDSPIYELHIDDIKIK